MDVLILELYGLKPMEFTAAREEYVAHACKAGAKQPAAAIGVLRKPADAAWTAGLLARQRPKEAQGLVQLGEALRVAHRTLDGDELLKLSHDQHVVIGELAGTARALAAEAGPMVSEPELHEVEQILHPVLADADADVAAKPKAERKPRALRRSRRLTCRRWLRLFRNSAESSQGSPRRAARVDDLRG
ncbi:hypothetical protein ACFYYB_26970 [Streptomyces sp. NPDC002886]|uniref:hypothetical protein n=1 Tax=Streptomyces sp. NPDC002886 TaxID=3364667 RepID=UPI003675AF04